MGTLHFLIVLPYFPPQRKIISPLLQLTMLVINLETEQWIPTTPMISSEIVAGCSVFSSEIYDVFLTVQPNKKKKMLPSKEKQLIVGGESSEADALFEVSHRFWH